MPAPTPPSSPEHIVWRTQSRLSLQETAPAPLPEAAPVFSDSPLGSSRVSDKSQGLDILQQRLNMYVPRPDAVLDSVLLEAISNMGLAKNSALAHALVSLGSNTLADVSWLTVDDFHPFVSRPLTIQMTLWN